MRVAYQKYHVPSWTNGEPVQIVYWSHAPGGPVGMASGWCSQFTRSRLLACATCAPPSVRLAW